jgi:hypothetical protein
LESSLADYGSPSLVQQSNLDATESRPQESVPRTVPSGLEQLALSKYELIHMTHAGNNEIVSGREHTERPSDDAVDTPANGGAAIITDTDDDNEQT